MSRPSNWIEPAVGSSSRTRQRAIGSSCRSPTRRRARASARSGAANVTSSTACTRATSRRTTIARPDREVAACRWSTRRASGVPFGLARRRSRRRLTSAPCGRPIWPSPTSRRRRLLLDREPAAIEMARRVGQCASSGGTSVQRLELVRAARPEVAALRRVQQRRRGARDRRQAPRALTIEARDRPEQSPRVGVLGVVEDLVERALLDDPPGVHDDDRGRRCPRRLRGRGSRG